MATTGRDFFNSHIHKGARVGTRQQRMGLIHGWVVASESKFILAEQWETLATIGIYWNRVGLSYKALQGISHT